MQAVASHWARATVPSPGLFLDHQGLAWRGRVMGNQILPLDEEEKERIDAKMDGSLGWSRQEKLVPSHFRDFLQLKIKPLNGEDQLQSWRGTIQLHEEFFR